MIKQPIFGRGMFLDTIVTAGKFVTISSEESVSLCGAAVPDGVAWSDGAIGDKITVELFGKGIVEVEAGAIIVAGALVESMAGGLVKTAATGLGMGKALTGGAIGAKVKVLVK